MIIKGLQDEVFGDYKKPSMQIVFPTCSFKCDKENGCKLCQNASLARSLPMSYFTPALIRRYLDNPITKAIVCGGLEPFDSPDDLLELVTLLREKCDDDVVIYTGYTPVFAISLSTPSFCASRHLKKFSATCSNTA